MSSFQSWKQRILKLVVVKLISPFCVYENISSLWKAVTLISDARPVRNSMKSWGFQVVGGCWLNCPLPLSLWPLCCDLAFLSARNIGAENKAQRGPLSSRPCETKLCTWFHRCCQEMNLNYFFAGGSGGRNTVFLWISISFSSSGRYLSPCVGKNSSSITLQPSWQNNMLVNYKLLFPQ